MRECSAVSVASDSATPWTTAYQAPPSMGIPIKVANSRSKSQGLRELSLPAKKKLYPGTFFHLLEYSGLWAIGGLGLQINRGLHSL